MERPMGHCNHPGVLGGAVQQERTGSPCSMDSPWHHIGSGEECGLGGMSTGQLEVRLGVSREVRLRLWGKSAYSILNRLS